MIINPLLEILPLMVMHETAQKADLLAGIPLIGRIARHSSNFLVLLSPGGIPYVLGKKAREYYRKKKEPV